MLPHTNMSCLGCQLAMKVLNHLPVWLLCCIRVDGVIVPARVCAFAIKSILLANDVERRVLPLDEKYELLTERPTICVAIAFGVPALLFEPWNFRISQILTTPSFPAEASVWPFGCKLIEKSKT